MTSSTDEELKLRLYQFKDITIVIADVRQKTRNLETQNRELVAQKTELEKKLEIKSGRLEFILDEKENLFSKLQKVMDLNQRLKKKQKTKALTQPKQGKGWFRGGWFSGVKEYFKKKDLETIDVSGGKVRKNIRDDGQPMGIDDQLENSQSFFTNQSDEDIVELRRKRNQEIQKEKRAGLEAKTPEKIEQAETKSKHFFVKKPIRGLKKKTNIINKMYTPK